MKTYEKPRLMALSLSSNDLLCNNCTPKLGGLDGIPGDLIDNFQLFQDRETCEYTMSDLENLGIEYDCKTTASDAIMFIS